MWLWMKTAFDTIQSQRQIFQEDISNKTNEMYNTGAPNEDIVQNHLT